MKVLVTGGFFDESGDGCVWGVDLAAGRADVLLRHTPPPALRVPTRGFTGACHGPDGRLYAAGHAAVFRIDTRGWCVDGTLHSPSFNDLHHVAADATRLYVANTGSDAIDLYTHTGVFIGSHGLAPGWVLARRMAGVAPPPDVEVAASGWDGQPPPGWSQEADDDGYHTPRGHRGELPYWRAKLPDRFHPNHVCLTGDAVLATCLQSGEIRDVTHHRTLVALPGQFPHDGILRADGLWCTTIDGGVWRAPWPNSGGAERILDVFAVSGRHGWCRGLWVGDDAVVVGLTEVRAGRLPRHRWADRAPEGSETSVCWIGRDGRLRGRVDLSDRNRHSKVYSVLPWRDG